MLTLLFACYQVQLFCWTSANKAVGPIMQGACRFVVHSQLGEQCPKAPERCRAGFSTQPFQLMPTIHQVPGMGTRLLSRYSALSRLLTER